MKNLFFSLFVFLSFFQLKSQPRQFEIRGIGGGGALFSPAVSPFDAQKIWMACDMTELFFTENGGLSWDFYDFRDFVSHTHSPVNFTSDPNLLYALRTSFRDGLVSPAKSTNGGQSWQPLANPQPDGLIYLFADPQHTQRLLASDWSRLYFSNDGGQSWQSRYDDNTGNLYIAGVFWDGQDIFVATYYGLLVSHNGGQSFQIETIGGMPANVSFASFTGAKQGGQRQFYAIAADKADLYPTVPSYDYTYGYDNIYRLQYGGASGWQAIGSSFDSNLKFLKVAASGTTADTIYAAGTDTDNSFPIVYKSTDKGANWSEIFKTQNNQNISTGYCGFGGDENWWYAEAPIGFAVQNGNSDVLLFTDFGFAHKSTDGGLSWKQLYVNPATENPAGSATPKGKFYQSNGLENTSSWWLEWTDAQTVFAAYTDIGGMYSNDGGLSWSFDKVDRDQNSTYHFLRHPQRNLLYAANSSVHDMYQSTYLQDGRIDGGRGRILFSQNGGSTWQLLHDFAHPVMYMAIDPNNPNVMYASVVHSSEGGIYKTSNLDAGAASVWTKLPNPPRTEGHPLIVKVLKDGSLLCSFSGRRAPDFTASSGVFWSNNGGQNWSDRSHPDMQYWTKDVIVDPHDPAENTWYAGVFSGWGGAANDKGGLFKTTDRGQTWTKMLSLFRVESCAIDPGNQNVMYVTTEDEGLWYTDNLRTANPEFRQLEKYKFQHPVRVFFNPFKNGEVWVSSFGNGLAVGAVTTGFEGEIQTAHFTAKVFPNPARKRLILDVQNFAASNMKLEITDVFGKILETRRHQFSTVETSNRIDWDISRLPAGIYFFKISDRQGSRVLKFVKD